MSVFAPDVVDVRMQVPPPLESVALQLAEPSVTTTVPVGEPLPGATGATTSCTRYGWPVTLGSGPSLTIDVVELDGNTECAAVPIEDE